MGYVIKGTTPTALLFRWIVHPGLARNEPTLGYQMYNAYSVGPRKYDSNALVVGCNMCNVCGVEPCEYDSNALVVGYNTCNVCGVELFKYDFNALAFGYNMCNVCGFEPCKRRSDRFEVMALICFGCVVEVY